MVPMMPMSSPAVWNTRATPYERMPIDLRMAISFDLPMTSMVIAAMMLNAATMMMMVRMLVMATFCVRSAAKRLWLSSSQSMTR